MYIYIYIERNTCMYIYIYMSMYTSIHINGKSKKRTHTYIYIYMYMDTSKTEMPQCRQRFCDHEERQQIARVRLGTFRKERNQMEGMERWFNAHARFSMLYGSAAILFPHSLRGCMLSRVRDGRELHCENLIEDLTRPGPGPVNLN